MSNCRTPTAMSPNNTPHASLQNSRMGTPATTYGAFGAGSMPGSSNASGSVVVSRALVVDWDIDVPLEADGRVASGFNQTLQVPNHSQQNSGTVSCTSGADGTISDGLNIRVNLGYAADVELRLFGQTEATAPFINLYSEGNNMPEFNISARTLHPLITTSSSSHRNDHSWTAPLLLSFSITASREYAPPTIYESASPAAYHRLSNFLDQPGGHDVVFCFPENKHLYADRYILQRCSPYFRRLFQASPQRGAVVVPPLESPTAQNLRSPSTPRGSEGSGSGGAATDDGFESEDITLQNFDDVQTPGTSVPPSSSGGEYPGVSDPTRIPLPRDSPPAAQSYTLQQRDQTPLVDDNIFVIDIKETSFNTMRAVLYYLYTDFITFAPLTSCFHNIHPFPARTSKTPRTEAINAEDEAIERRRLAARNAVVGEYMQNHPCRPVPVSPKSVYAIAKKYEIPALETQALIRITTVSERDPIVAISELFSPFSRVHGSARIPQLETVIASWENVVRRSGEWEVVRSRCVKVADTYFSGILCEILDRLP
ncbi:hypothetical protein FRB94_012564 [Tulasnella sp. JGI-2019a]|nr:hypothetical protein FRB93_001472 [Tulasnella sp. JGI-2019a]KAG9009041.1 hypothetical protein FRB94_012564 [Tulasnella sp. JGI-2019a]KAG9026253.1 hypothetical protein FRB95_009053 [Tulasnella sp. JGI-2019a]